MYTEDLSFLICVHGDFGADMCWCNVTRKQPNTPPGNFLFSRSFKKMKRRSSGPFTQFTSMVIFCVSSTMTVFDDQFSFSRNWLSSCYMLSIWRYKWLNSDLEQLSSSLWVLIVNISKCIFCLFIVKACISSSLMLSIMLFLTFIFALF